MICEIPQSGYDPSDPDYKLWCKDVCKPPKCLLSAASWPFRSLREAVDDCRRGRWTACRAKLPGKDSDMCPGGGLHYNVQCRSGKGKWSWEGTAWCCETCVDDEVKGPDLHTRCDNHC